LIWDKKSKVFAIYDKNHGLIFSKKPRSKSLLNRWMKDYGESELKILGKGDFEKFSSEKFIKFDCDKDKCEIEILKNGSVERVLILLRRNQIDDICSKAYDRVINLNAKYSIPHC